MSTHASIVGRRRVAQGVVLDGYAEITSNSASVTAVTNISGLELTFTAFADRRYRLTFSGEIAQSVAGDVFILGLAESGGSQLKWITGSNASTASRSVEGSYVNNASISGSKTWRVNLQRFSGTGNITIGASATSPAYIMVEDIGPL